MKTLKNIGWNIELAMEVAVAEVANAILVTGKYLVAGSLIWAAEMAQMVGGLYVKAVKYAYNNYKSYLAVKISKVNCPWNKNYVSEMTYELAENVVGWWDEEKMNEWIEIQKVIEKAPKAENQNGGQVKEAPKAPKAENQNGKPIFGIQINGVPYAESKNEKGRLGVQIGKQFIKYRDAEDGSAYIPYNGNEYGRIKLNKFMKGVA